MRVLVITGEWPSAKFPASGVFVHRQVNSLREANVDVEVFHFRGGKSPFNYFLAWLRCQRLIGQNKYDLIHSQFGQSGLLVLPKRLPLVVTFRGSDLIGDLGYDCQAKFLGLLLRNISRMVARFADEVIVSSKELASLADRPCQIIPSGIDLGLFMPQPREKAREFLGLSESKKLIFFAAAPDNPIKRYSLASEAVKLVQNCIPAEIIVANNIPHNLMPVYMNACDVLLVTSSHEGSPNVVKEALACNLPVVSVDVGDVRTLLSPIKGCIVCTDDDPQTIADALCTVLRKLRRIQGREAIQHLDEDQLTQDVIRVYQRLLDRFQKSKL